MIDNVYNGKHIEIDINLCNINLWSIEIHVRTSVIRTLERFIVVWKLPNEYESVIFFRSHGRQL